ncbi:hypothetical protein [Lentibacillus saliphilus]|uniref:hypothetical protein n=1 Tax=Lentibacillus saliphilus TaxID=2737028 RepID=UPI001C2FBFA0|nr:hypothetical protein [Lentibacillus saliphilus]
MPITEKEMNDKAYAAGILAGNAELFLEGRVPGQSGMNKLTEALEIVEQYQMTNEEIGIYVQEVVPDASYQVQRFITRMMRAKGVNNNG